MKISSFYEDILGANFANARWSWGATSPLTNQLFLRVWDDNKRMIDGVEHILILDNSWTGTSPGLSERKKHVQDLRNGVEGFGVVCKAQNIEVLGSRTIKNFDSQELLKLGDVIDVEHYVYAEIAGLIPVKEISRPQTAYSTVLPDLKSIFSKCNEATTKEALAKARIGQGIFRKEVLRNWGKRCCVTGSSTEDAIRASHIKPWCDSNDQERLDRFNGLPLIATLDAVFDCGLISFSADGELLVANCMTNEERKILDLENRRMSRTPPAETTKYLEYHRRVKFRGNYLGDSV